MPGLTAETATEAPSHPDRGGLCVCAHAHVRQAIEFFRYDSSLTDEEKKKANEIKLPGHLNIAACALKLKDYKTAKENCDKARGHPGRRRRRQWALTRPASARPMRTAGGGGGAARRSRSTRTTSRRSSVAPRPSSASWIMSSLSGIWQPRPSWTRPTRTCGI